MRLLQHGRTEDASKVAYLIVDAAPGHHGKRRGVAQRILALEQDSSQFASRAVIIMSIHRCAHGHAQCVHICVRALSYMCVYIRTHIHFSQHLQPLDHTRSRSFPTNFIQLPHLACLVSGIAGLTNVVQGK